MCRCCHRRRRRRCRHYFIIIIKEGERARILMLLLLPHCQNIVCLPTWWLSKFIAKFSMRAKNQLFHHTITIHLLNFLKEFHNCLLLIITIFQNILILSINPFNIFYRCIKKLSLVNLLSSSLHRFYLLVNLASVLKMCCCYCCLFNHRAQKVICCSKK